MRLARAVSIFVFILFAAIRSQAEGSGPAHLWRVEQNGKVFFLLGSLHTFPGRSLDPEVYRAIEGADKIVTETNEELSEFFLLFNNPLVLPKGESLERMLSPAAWRNLVDLLGVKTPADVELIRTLSPSAAAQEVLKVRKARVAGEDIKVLEMVIALRSGQMEDDLRNFAKSKKMKADTLDSAKGLAAVFSLPVESLERLLLASDQEFHDEMLKQLQQSLELIEQYPQGRISAIKKEMRSSPPEHRKRLYTDRNREWLPKIKQLAGDKTVFIVGSGHLYGQEGLLALLASDGYQVSRMFKPVGRCSKLFGVGKD